LIIEISTILSLTILIPVVSKSKKQIGRFKFIDKDILNHCIWIPRF